MRTIVQLPHDRDGAGCHRRFGRLAGRIAQPVKSVGKPLRLGVVKDVPSDDGGPARPVGGFARRYRSLLLWAESSANGIGDHRDCDEQ